MMGGPLRSWQGSAIFETLAGWNLRLRLDRWWDDRPRALVCMANPSTAGADKNDPTIWRLFDLFKNMDVGGFTVVNWEPYIATDPSALHVWRAHASGNFPDEYAKIRAMNLGIVRELGVSAPIRFVAWGSIIPQVPLTTKILAAMSGDHTHDLYAFDLTKGEHPKHPMARGHHRIANDAVPIVWRKARGVAA